MAGLQITRSHYPYKPKMKSWIYPFNLPRISSIVKPSARSFSTVESSSVFCAFSAALASALAFLASSLAMAFSADFSAARFDLSYAFRLLICSRVSAMFCSSCAFSAVFSAMAAAKSVVTFAALGLFLLPLGLGMGYTSVL